MMIPISAAFADNDNCWSIFCWFDFSQKTSNDQNYSKHQQKVKVVFMDKIQEEISSLKKTKKTISQGENLDIIPELNSLNNKIDNRINALQGIIDSEEEVKKNPGKYLRQSDLVNRALNYYKNQPDGTPCDEDERWVDDKGYCRSIKRATKAFYTWDLEWLRDHPELDNMEIKNEPVKRR